MVTKQSLHPCDWGLPYLHHQVTMQCHKAPQSNYLVCPQRKNDKTKCSLVGCKTKHKTAHAFLDIRATEDSVGDLYCNSYVSSREIFLCLRLTTSSVTRVTICCLHSVCMLIIFNTITVPPTVLLFTCVLFVFMNMKQWHKRSPLKQVHPSFCYAKWPSQHCLLFHLHKYVWSASLA